MEGELKLRIILENPPSEVDFGLQKGRGTGYETVQKQRSKGTDLCFEFAAKLKGTKKSPPDFIGPIVQGQSSARFVYLDIGTFAGQTETPWNRRLKVPLTGITWDMVARLSKSSDAVLETHVSGTGRDGGPNCGTAKPFAGWRVATP